jgi:hypothetical protein
MHANSNKQQFLFADESVHPRLGFLVVALVAIGDVDTVNGLIGSALRHVGLEPGRDEAKWSTYVRDNPERAWLRRTISDLVKRHAQVGLIVASLDERSSLLSILDQAITTLVNDGQLPAAGVLVVDQGLTGGQTASFDSLSGWSFRLEQDSKQELGLQLADAAAGELALAMRYQLEDIKKFHEPRGEGHEGQAHNNDTYWAVGNLERMEYRYSLFGKDIMVQYVAGEEPFRECVDHGVFISSELPQVVQDAARRAFGRLYLGCMA